MSTIQAQRDVLVAAAVDYAARGWPVLALRPKAKTPLLAHGLHDASTDLVVVRSWWLRWPDANVGLRTGVCFDVLDVDGPDGLDALGDHIPVDGEPLTGPTAVTGHGWHTYVAPTGNGNRTGLVDHVDWRGRGGYVVAPPSVHPGGHVYRWAFGDQGPIRPAPAWLVDLVGRPSISHTERSTPWKAPGGRKARHYGVSALHREASTVAGAAEGERNATLVRAAFRAGQLVAVDALEADAAAAVLLSAATFAGLGEAEASRTIASGLDAGRRSPR